MNKINFLLDAGIFLAFLLALEPELTGLEIHEWLSVALAGTLILHLFLHWDWVVGVLKTFFCKLIHISRLKFVVDALLLVAMIAVMVSGLMISRVVLPVLGLTVPENQDWRMLHTLSADLVLWLTALHFALNWKWVVSMIKRYVVAPIASLQWRTVKPQVQPIPVEIEHNRKS
ncbi:DUF4405 domain-containing protein [Anaerolinea thermophila]|uniref:Hypothetical membrane protein n=1 Tax=Anaerolinea thermophila (strain DSM 14523 / JCM 11388 / NBRC 100420 / UNI-1) TaxID=926569 RepID=E8N2M4_ANATU|nr:DUF4405 domain-containing protein [Anaerolinea thermophila]BAJ62830.1 hypothetical membrane protein [Anaerolinea thermophila UNI-1]